MSIPLTDTFGFTPNKPNIDKRYLANNGQPYTSVSAAETALASRLVASCVGLTVLVADENDPDYPEAKEYWVQPKGTTPETYGLVEKGAGTTDYNDLDNKPTISDGGQGSLQIPVAGNVKVTASTASGDTAGVTITQGQTAGEIEMQFTLPKGENGENGVTPTIDPTSKHWMIGSTDTNIVAEGQDGAPGHNPCLGRFNVLPTLSPNPFADARKGDYIYFDTTDQQTSDPVTYIYYFDGTDWDTTGTLVDVSNLSFSSGQDVTGVAVKDIDGNDDPNTAGVLSAEAGNKLGKELYGDNTQEWQEITEGIIEGAYYNTHNEPLPSSSLSNEGTTNNACIRIEVEVGEKIKLSTKGNNDYVRGWVFTDENRNRLLQDTNASSTGTVYDNVELPAAPENAHYLYVNTTDKTNYPISLYKKGAVHTSGLIEKVEELENEGKFKTLEELKDVSIVDSLDSDNPHDVLSAKQGKVINEQLNGEEGFAVYTEGFKDNTWVNTHGSSFSNRGSNDDTASIITPCNAGDKFKVYGTGNNDYVQLYAFANNGTYVYKPAQNLNTRDSGLVLTIPDGVNQLVINFIDYSAQTDKLEKWGKLEKGIVDDVRELQEEMSDIDKKSVIDGKTIVVFGDSMTEFKVGGIRWTDLAEQISGATFTNVAIGGTQLKSRVPLITKFDADKSYDSGARVYYGTPNEMRCYKFTSAHSGAWTDEDVVEETSSYIYASLDICNMVAASCDINTEIEHRFDNQVAAAECVKFKENDDNTAIITELSEIDWTNVDAVIIAGGGNDFGPDENKYGTPGDVELDATNKTFSALNFIVKKLSLAYPTIPIYGVKQLVRWWGWRGSSNTSETWCDNYIDDEDGNLTYGEFLEKIKEQYVANHIPVINWYDELGWNRHNFEAFFGNHTIGDGTHPKTQIALRQMAEKVVSFIIANKVFE